MNRYARDMISRRDGRNPYGSAGGYITRTRPRGRDRASEDMRRGRGRDMAMEDMARGGRGGSRGGRGRDYNYGNDFNYDYNSEYNGRQDYRDYAEYDMGGNSMDYEQSRQYDRDYEYEQDGHYGRRYTPIEAMGRFTGYYGGEDYNDYYDGNAKLSTKELKKWEKELENADGTKGKKWEVDQIKQVAQQHNIRFDEYRPETLTAVANMLYSDFCKVLGGDVVLYVKLAKAFLDDDDFEGEPEEKVMLYYKCIVSKDD